MKANKAIAVIGGTLLAANCWLLSGCSSSPQEKVAAAKREGLNQCLKNVETSIGVRSIQVAVGANETIVKLTDASNDWEMVRKFYNLKDKTVTIGYYTNAGYGSTETALTTKSYEEMGDWDKSVYAAVKTCVEQYKL